MITSFLSSWDLFAASYLSGWLAALTLSVLGVFVVAREQIFLGAAVAQTSVLGIALSLLVSDSEILAAAGASFFSIAASLAGEKGGGEGRESREAVTGWIFLSAGGLSVLLLAKSPHGTEEIHRLASSTLLGATPVDVWIFLVIAAAVFTAVSLFRRMLLLWVMDPACAAAIGLPVTALSIGLPAGLGLTVGLSIRASGMIYTFGCLVLPALFARSICREVGQMLWVAPLTGLSASITGFILANSYDLPPGQMVTVLLCAFLPAGWVVRSQRERRGRRWMS